MKTVSVVLEGVDLVNDNERELVQAGVGHNFSFPCCRGEQQGTLTVEREGMDYHLEQVPGTKR